MRMQSRSFISILAVLMVLFSSGVIAEDYELVDITIPSMEDVHGEDALPKYLNPSEDFTNLMIQWANTCTQHAINLRVTSNFLVDKRGAAHTAAYGGWNWKSKLTGLGQAVVTNSYSGLLTGFINDLIAMEGKIDREQTYAYACKEVNKLHPVLRDANDMMNKMHAVAVQVVANYEGSTSGLYRLIPTTTITLPTVETPSWGCMGNDVFVQTCDDTYDTPYKAKNGHRVWCGGYKDPNPDVAGCGVDYYSCREFYVSFHQVLYCSRHIDWFPPAAFRGTQIGICGEAFRKCPGSLSRSGVHAYQPVVKWSSSGTYWSGYEAVEYTDIGVGTYTETDHSGNTTPPVAESGTPIVHGSNGVGVEAVIPDESSNCDTCIDGSPNCPNASAHSGEEEADAGGTTPTDSSWVVCDIEGCRDSTPYDPTSSSAGLHAYHSECSQYKCNDQTHVEEQCTITHENGDRCTYTFWRCVYPDVGANGPSHPHVYPFSPSVSLNSQSYSAGGSVSISITSAAPINGAHLYVRVPGDTSRYGTQIGWFSGNNDRTTTTLPLSYTFPDDAALGTYQIALRVYPWSGSMYGVHLICLSL